MKILAVDPGETFGLVVGEMTASIHDLRVSWSVQRRLDLGDTDLKYLESLVQAVDMVVCEDVVPRPGIAPVQQILQLAQYVGAVRAICSLLSKPLTLQVPSCKAYVEVGLLLQHTGLIVRGQHAKDALTHLLFFVQGGASPKEPHPQPARRGVGKRIGTGGRKPERKKVRVRL